MMISDWPRRNRAALGDDKYHGGIILACDHDYTGEGVVKSRSVVVRVMLFAVGFYDPVLVMGVMLVNYVRITNAHKTAIQVRSYTTAQILQSA